MISSTRLAFRNSRHHMIQVDEGFGKVWLSRSIYNQHLILPCKCMRAFSRMIVIVVKILHESTRLLRLGLCPQLPLDILHRIRIPLPPRFRNHLCPLLMTQRPIPLAECLVIVLFNLERLARVLVRGHDGSVCDVGRKWQVWMQGVAAGGLWRSDFSRDIGSQLVTRVRRRTRTHAGDLRRSCPAHPVPARQNTGPFHPSPETWPCHPRHVFLADLSGDLRLVHTIDRCLREH